MRDEDLPFGRGRTILRYVLSLAYFGVGVVHLVAADKFMPIMPDWVPHPHDVILGTGVCEILGAIGLLTRRLRGFAGVMLALYAICVFPANIKHAVDNVQVPGLPLTWWYHGPRLAFQPVIVWWALFAGEVIDWPWRHRRAGRL